MKAGQLSTIINKISTEKGESISEIAKQAKVDRSNLSTLINGNAEAEIGKVTFRKLSNAYPAYFTNTNKSNSSDSSNKGGKKYVRVYAEGATDASLLELIASNKALADATLVREKANLVREEKERKLVETNAELTGILKATGYGHVNNPLGDPANLSSLLRVLAKIGVGAKLWKTEDDGLIELGNALAVPGGEVKMMGGTGLGVGKKRTSK
jgi:transcriptional regulator with XRE-family HTH domain